MMLACNLGPFICLGRAGDARTGFASTPALSSFKNTLNHPSVACCRQLSIFYWFPACEWKKPPIGCFHSSPGSRFSLIGWPVTSLSVLANGC